MASFVERRSASTLIAQDHTTDGVCCQDYDPKSVYQSCRSGRRKLSFDQTGRLKDRYCLKSPHRTGMWVSEASASDSESEAPAATGNCLFVPAAVGSFSELKLKVGGFERIVFESGCILSELSRSWPQGDLSSLQSICIPACTTVVVKALFHRSRCLHTVSFESPSRVRELEPEAFQDCSVLKAICVPSSVEVIGHNCFEECSSVEVTFETGSELRKLGRSAFRHCRGLSAICILSSVAVIPRRCFAGCRSLATVLFESDAILRKISHFAFVDCSSIAEIPIPASVKQFGESCFSGCSSIQSISIGINNHSGLTHSDVEILLLRLFIDSVNIHSRFGQSHWRILFLGMFIAVHRFV
jgi:hypothetical protein